MDKKLLKSYPQKRYRIVRKVFTGNGKLLYMRSKEIDSEPVIATDTSGGGLLNKVVKVLHRLFYGK